MVRLNAFFGRRRFNRATMAALLLPFAGVVGNEVIDRPAAAEAKAMVAPAVAERGAATAAPRALPDAPTPVLDRAVAETPASPRRAALRASMVDAAVAALSVHVPRTSSTDALRTAFQAYFNYRAVHREEVRKPYLYFVDLGLDNRTPRGYVFDMEKMTLVEGPFMVAHGRGSAAGGDGVPTTFSNRSGSAASSLGVYLAQETYAFSGKSGGVRYTSVGLRMRGESPGFNDAARPRGVVAHGAPYVTATRAGRSEGCPAMEPERAARLLPLLADGGVVFVYSPNDPRWPQADPWVQASSN
jgi:hypothetical protein